MTPLRDRFRHVPTPARAGAGREGYLLAAALSVAVLAVMAVLQVGTDALLFSPMLAAVVVSAVLWGIGPGGLSLVIGCLGSATLIAEPALSVRVGDPEDLAGLAAFTTLGAALVAFAGSYRRALSRVGELQAEHAAEVERRLLEQQSIAAALQEGLLPSRIDPPDWLRIAVRYRPARESLTVGGDFYDAFACAGEFVLVVGDVCGKGPEAAALTAVARNTLRATVADGIDLARCMSLVNRRILEEHRSPADFLTLVVCAARPEPDGVVVRCAAAGHPPPLIVRARCVSAVDAHGELLGVFPEPRFVIGEALLGPGDRLVLYTDGITEARMPNGELGQAGLSWLLALEDGGDEEHLADRLLDTVVNGDAPRRDDVALLIAGVPVTPVDAGGEPLG